MTADDHRLARGCAIILLGLFLILDRASAEADAERVMHAAVASYMAVCLVEIMLFSLSSRK